MTIKLAHQKLQLLIILIYPAIIWLVVGNNAIMQKFKNIYYGINNLFNYLWNSRWRNLQQQKQAFHKWVLMGVLIRADRINSDNR